MKRPSKKDIKDSIAKLKAKSDGAPAEVEMNSSAKLTPKQTSQRIRKQGI